MVAGLLRVRDSPNRSETVPNSTKPVVLSVAEATSVHAMDGGDTLALRFKAPNGREITLVVPQKAAANLQAHISDGLEAALEQRSTRRHTATLRQPSVSS